MQKVQTGDIDFVLLSTANASTAQPESGVFSIHFIFRDESARHQGAWRPQRDRGDEGAVRRQDEGRAHARPWLAGPAAHVRQEAGAEGRRPQRHQDARAGHRDGRHHFPGLRRAGRAHAVRRGLYVAADRRRRHGRERHQQLPHQQALRTGAGAFAHRARSQQRRAVRQRQGLDQPDRRAEEMGAGGGRRGQPERAGRRLQA